ncbi:type II CRISPR RNA-guided endonuclease Cas9 [Mucilaginibacter sp. RS28]|uniref:CRISPR-associated endonuclease Cas9 n=1 Tax=Mucilaginibacter straminoryzae TaxID=2932774 RepID=A0A9X2B9I1_9SPHI|nr:type II CRISPR RNA-guided endonuclease Cas9 [Mucilaginibacter straminoryzae]MCJ8210659.1 type II CRISPR RNA-guided endonuclease Cas9 [Mucilaginibacter straminoryzae]
MKKILGIDLGTTSIGWAFVHEAEENDTAPSAIIKLGVRVNPLTTDEKEDFSKGKPVSVNAGRTLKRTARHNLQRYKQRRQNLINVLKHAGLITADTPLAEDDKNTTHQTYALRARAVTERIEKEELARVLLMINKKRGYKSSRKAKNEDEGQLIDGMEVARKLYNENLTPGQLSYQLLQEGKKSLPEFYRSDLKAEFENVWQFQSQFYPEIFTKEFKKDIEGKGQKATSAAFWNRYAFNTAENKGNWIERKLRAYKWRSMAIATQLTAPEAAYVITEINNNISNSSGYLGEISDRSKELIFNNQTVGQYLYHQLQQNPHAQTKNKVFYRQDYLNEFEAIWEKQAGYHPELTAALKKEVRDIIIFYQRKLKSQKGLVNFCEFESKVVEFEKDGKKIKYQMGARAIPKSSPLFQEFKIWQNLGNLQVQHKKIREPEFLSPEAKEKLFASLNLKGNLPKDEVLKLLELNPKEWELNYTTVEGNRTNQLLYAAFFKLMELEGHDEIDWLKLPAEQIKNTITKFFSSQGIDASILDFDALQLNKAIDQQSAYQLWHLLYAYEGDDSPTGNEKLYQLLQSKFGFKKVFGQELAKIGLQDDYGSLSAKAIKKIFPYIRENKYSEACALAGYNHSSYLTREENENRPLKETLVLLPRNSLRNPVVEKILNQMVNVVNAIIADPLLGRPDEVRIELARELKKNAKEREAATLQLNKTKAEHEAIRALLIKEFGVKNPTRNDIIRYKLYDELKFNGYKDLYTNEYISREELFTHKYDIEHIIPQSRLFDDSFSNKTVVLRSINLRKGNATAFDFIKDTYGEQALSEYKTRLEAFMKFYPERKAKYNKLLLQGAAIGEGFIERDLRDTQYIAKKAKAMLHEICRSVVTTTGIITDRLRDDWGLVNIMQELNLEKYRLRGLTEKLEMKDGNLKERIIDWSKRHDHRHHAMDALTIAFTKHSYIQYLNHLNARNKEDKFTESVLRIQSKETKIATDGKRRFNLPVPHFREQAKEHLEATLVSVKAKNKVVTKNKNKIKTANGEKIQETLTPRGQLHKETVYGKVQKQVVTEEKVSTKFTAETIACVTNEAYRDALFKRLNEYGNDPVKAFGGKNVLAKNPLYISGSAGEQVPEKVKLLRLEDDYTIRKDITPDNFKDKKSIEKILDGAARNIILKRWQEFNENPKEAFSNLDKNPIWLNKAKGISIKRVTISGVKNAEPLHFKKDHLGREILRDGKPVPADFISTGNNHHAAIYRDEDGNLQDEVVSLHKVITERINMGLPIIDKSYNQHLGWRFLFTIKQNEYFVFPSVDFDPAEIDLLDPANNKLISPYLYRVQKFSKLTYGNSAVREYVFRHHQETSVEDKKELKDVTYRNIKSLPYLEKIVKVRINHLGQIIKIGEY